jgi:hypothetical protein
MATIHSTGSFVYNEDDTIVLKIRNTHCVVANQEYLGENTWESLKYRAKRVHDNLNQCSSLTIQLPESTEFEVGEKYMAILCYLHILAKNAEQLKKAYGWAMEVQVGAMKSLLEDTSRSITDHVLAMNMIHVKIFIPALQSRLPAPIQEPVVKDHKELDQLLELAIFFKSAEVMSYISERKIKLIA